MVGFGVGLLVGAARRLLIFFDAKDFERLQLPRAPMTATFKLPLNQYVRTSFKAFNWTGVLPTAPLKLWKKDALTGKTCRHGRKMVQISSLFLFVVFIRLNATTLQDILSSNPSLTFTASELIALFRIRTYEIR